MSTSKGLLDHTEDEAQLPVVSISTLLSRRDEAQLGSFLGREGAQVQEKPGQEGEEGGLGSSAECRSVAAAPKSRACCCAAQPPPPPCHSQDRPLPSEHGGQLRVERSTVCDDPDDPERRSATGDPTAPAAASHGGDCPSIFPFPTSCPIPAPCRPEGEVGGALPPGGGSLASS